VLKSDTLSIENNHVEIDRERARMVVETSLTAREQRQLLFAELDEPPEKRFIELITEQGTKLGDERFPLNALFFTTSLIFAQDTTRFFKRISDAELLDRYAWIFQPEIVVAEDAMEKDIVSICQEYLKPAGYSRSALDQWVHNSTVLKEEYDGDLRSFFRSNADDAIEVVRALEVFPRAKTHEKDGLRRFGPKLSRLFIQWVSQYKLYDLKNTDKIGLPVDFQVARIFVQTGALPLKKPLQTHKVTHKILLPSLTEMCEENGWKPQQVSETLWLIGSRCCSKKRHDLCPVSDMCDKLISRKPYDRAGMFDPKDVGRFDT
jgi:hypothetical protein